MELCVFVTLTLPRCAMLSATWRRVWSWRQVVSPSAACVAAAAAAAAVASAAAVLPTCHAANFDASGAGGGGGVGPGGPPSAATFRSFFQQAKNCGGNKKCDSGRGALKGLLSNRKAGTAAAAAGAAGGAGSKPQCPSKDDIGVCTWTLLHLIASEYPEVADADTQRAALGFIEGLGRFYPCLHCRADFQEELVKSPPRLGGRVEFSLWVCEQHNAVNRKLNKPTFTCSIEALDTQWLKPCLPDEDEDDDEE